MFLLALLSSLVRSITAVATHLGHESWKYYNRVVPGSGPSLENTYDTYEYLGKYLFHNWHAQDAVDFGFEVFAFFSPRTN